MARAETLMGPLLLTWFNFNSSMDKKSHTRLSVEWDYLSIAILQRYKFGNEWVISSHTLLDMWLLIHVGIQV